jgi:hypothetical protein
MGVVMAGSVRERIVHRIFTQTEDRIALGRSRRGFCCKHDLNPGSIGKMKSRWQPDDIVIHCADQVHARKIKDRTWCRQWRSRAKAWPSWREIVDAAVKSVRLKKAVKLAAV